MRTTQTLYVYKLPLYLDRNLPFPTLGAMAYKQVTAIPPNL